MGIILRSDGTTQYVDPKNGTDFQLDELQGFVGGLIGVLSTRDGRALVIHDEGKLEGYPINWKATELWKYGMYDRLHGDVFICKHEEIQ